MNARCGRLALPVLLALLPVTAPADATKVRDDLGRQVSLARPAQRVVTLAPHATELVVAAGATENLVGIAAGSKAPAGLAALPRVGGPGALDREALLALRPDLVIGWQSGNRAGDLDWIARSGIALFRSEPMATADIAAAIRAIGTLTGQRRSAARAADGFERDLLTPCARLPRQTAYVVVWDRPPMSVGGRHWINSAMHHAGYRNLFEHLDRGVFAISAEAAFAHRALPRLDLVRGPRGGEADDLADLMARPGPRLAEAVQLLCRLRLRGRAPATSSAPSAPSGG